MTPSSGEQFIYRPAALPRETLVIDAARGEFGPEIIELRLIFGVESGPRLGLGLAGCGIGPDPSRLNGLPSLRFGRFDPRARLVSGRLYDARGFVFGVE